MDHARRRTRLAERLSDPDAALDVDALLITFLPNVRYLTGYTGSNGQVLVSADGARFFTDGRYIEQSRQEVPDLDRVIVKTAFAKELAKAAADLGVSRIGFESDHVTYKTFEQLSEEVTVAPLADEVGRLRWIKDAEELELIERAQQVTDEAFEAVTPKLGIGISEREVALLLEHTMREAGADGLAFESIAAFGENAAEPHHSPTSRVLAEGDIIKLDFGALYEGYHSDMTRTVAFGDLSPRMREVYDVVKASQQAGLDAVEAGITGGAADAASREVIAEAGFGDSFTHSLGHGVGLEIHEGPTLRDKGDDVLPVGAVVTVEPGIYLPGTGGVRIEDMVEVTEDGCRVIPSATKELVIL